jgi:acyl-coenzyme A thioesterase PaaI-like protein
VTHAPSDWRLRLMRWMHWWPPLLGAGIRVRRMDRDLRAIDVEMRLTALNRNVMGTHFGGSLYAMTDPFYMLMLMENLNPGGSRGYVVWDKAATIRYKRPGTGTVRAEFRLSAERIEEIRTALAVPGVEKVEPVFLIEVKDEVGQIVAEVEKTIYCARTEVHGARRRAASGGIQ